MIIQLTLLAQKFQSMLNTIRGTNHHSAIRICALFTAGQHKLADNQTLQHGNQECAQQHQAGMQQRYINIENRLDRTNHQSREKRAFDQYRVQLVTVTHHMTVVHANTMQAVDPNQRASKRIQPQTNMEMETGRIQRFPALPHIYDCRSGNK